MLNLEEFREICFIFSMKGKIGHRGNFSDPPSTKIFYKTDSKTWRDPKTSRQTKHIVEAWVIPNSYMVNYILYMPNQFINCC